MKSAVNALRVIRSVVADTPADKLTAYTWYTSDGCGCLLGHTIVKQPQFCKEYGITSEKDMGGGRFLTNAEPWDNLLISLEDYNTLFGLEWPTGCGIGQPYKDAALARLDEMIRKYEALSRPEPRRCDMLFLA